jgi:hypothetical protein
VRTKRFSFLIVLLNFLSLTGSATDHNEPNSINSIFSDVQPDAADLYGLFGYPSKLVESGGRPDVASLVVMMTFAPAPHAGAFDEAVAHRIFLKPTQRSTIPELKENPNSVNYSNPEAALKAAKSRIESLKNFVKKDFANHILLNPVEVNVSYKKVEDKWRANISFKNFRFPDQEIQVPTNEVTTLQFLVPQYGVSNMKVFIGGRDDPFFTDLNGFFHSINYMPYLDKLKGNPFPLSDGVRSENPRAFESSRVKSIVKLSDGDYKYTPSGQLQTVYAARDDRAGLNANAIILEIPQVYLTNYEERKEKRQVRIWGEGYRRKAVATTALLNWLPKYPATKDAWLRLDTLGIPFVDTVLGQREERFNTGWKNLVLQDDYVKRLAHLSWAFAPALEQIGYDSCFRYDRGLVKFPTKVDVITPKDLLAQVPHAVNCLTQRMRMADDSWRVNKFEKIKPPVVLQLFHPNTLVVDLDTTGTWPFGRRPEDQIASRFTSLFLNYNGQCGQKTGNIHRCNVDSLQAKPNNDRVIGLPINPEHNDVPFLTEFPYLADAHPEGNYGNK